ncbi:hypothetical protein GH714_013910 [Hevea brasiliensis]|uniref:Uncharacterized protein n=1 Tax=Hevea brasiliensis TaxID=3981 RepID=A0A6A6LRI1_HEVBR|nr:hypothetical protein GH714_013910 [Hevea brasiliensis]
MFDKKDIMSEVFKCKLSKASSFTILELVEQAAKELQILLGGGYPNPPSNPKGGKASAVSNVLVKNDVSIELELPTLLTITSASGKVVQETQWTDIDLLKGVNKKEMEMKARYLPVKLRQRSGRQKPSVGLTTSNLIFRFWRGL